MSPHGGTARRDRAGETHSLADFLPAERRRIMDGASETRRAQMRAAEARGRVFQAWNDVCAGTREGAHVTGLHYAAESDELIVYADGATWVAELTMMREIIRARMHLRGVDVSDIKVLRSREDYIRRQPPASPAATAAAVAMSGTRSAGSPRKEAAPHRGLSAAEERALDDEVSAIGDTRLRDALKNAMRASLESRTAPEG